MPYSSVSLRVAAGFTCEPLLARGHMFDGGAAARDLLGELVERHEARDGVRQKRDSHGRERRVRARERGGRRRVEA
jgi:hypothetical protein